MKSKLSPQEAAAVSRISGLVLINALLFQEVLSQHEGRVKTLQATLNQGNPIAAFTNQWKFVLENINYYPIFHIAREILGNLSSTADTTSAIVGLAETAQRIVGHRAALRHDLMGRVYHRLLADKKYLATYYTSIPAATLLLRLALRDDAQSAWGNEETLTGFRVADLACGTGTLLMAAADSIADAHIRARAREMEYACSTSTADFFQKDESLQSAPWWSPSEIGKHRVPAGPAGVGSYRFVWCSDGCRTNERRSI